MQLFYLSCACSAQKYAQLFNEIECKPGQQVQKYHRLFARGFALNQCDVDMISALPLTRKNYDKRFYKTNQEELNGLKYDYLSILNFPMLKHIGIVWQTVSTIIKKRKRGIHYMRCFKSICSIRRRDCFENLALSMRRDCHRFTGNVIGKFNRGED